MCLLLASHFNHGASTTNPAMNHLAPSLQDAVVGQETETFLSPSFSDPPPIRHPPNLILGFAPAPQVSPATQAAYHHMGTCRAPPLSRPTITRSPRAWMDTALPPCPIWAAPRPSSMAQLPTRPMPVSRDVCPVFLHIFALRTGRRAVWPTVQVSPVPSLRAPAPPGAGPGDGTKASTVPGRNLCPPCSPSSPSPSQNSAATKTAAWCHCRNPSFQSGGVGFDSFFYQLLTGGCGQVPLPSKPQFSLSICKMGKEPVPAPRQLLWDLDKIMHVMSSSWGLAHRRCIQQI